MNFSFGFFNNYISKYIFVIFVCFSFSVKCYSKKVIKNNESKSHCTEVSYVANPKYPPYHWQNGTAYKGLSIKLLEKISENTKIKFVPKFYPWVRALKMIEEGDVDIVLSLKKTPEREYFMTFSPEPVFPNPMSVFYNSSNKFEYKEWLSLKKFKGGVSLGDKFGDGFDEFLGKELNVDIAPTMEENFIKLQNQRIDYFITGRYVGLYYIKETHLESEIKVQDLDVNKGFIYFGYSKKSKCNYEIDLINKEINKLNHTKWTDKILKDIF